MLAKVTLCLLSWFLALSAQANLQIELTQGVSSAQTIHIESFVGQALVAEDKQFGKIIANDLVMSGRFKLSPPNAAESILKGEVKALGDDQVSVTISLFDQLDNSKKLLTKTFKTTGAGIRYLAHYISDLVYQEIIGDPGIFTTKLAYILAQERTYKLMVADVDGHHAKAVVTASYPIMSPNWSPDGKQLAYVSFANKRAQINLLELATGREQQLTAYPGINGAPAWSPDGKNLALVLSKSGSPCIYVMDVRSKRLTQLTHGTAIDTEPSWSLDGNKIYFTSDRGGSPQIYAMDSHGQNLERITFDGAYNATPHLTRNNQQLVLLHRDNAGYNIAIQDLASGVLQNLTYTGNTDSPALAPNDRMIIFASQDGKYSILNMVSTDGQIRLKLPSPLGNVQEPAWGPKQ